MLFYHLLFLVKLDMFQLIDLDSKLFGFKVAEITSAELRPAQLQEVLNSLEPVDREILALRHFEQLSNVETAQVLGMSESGATARHVRALKRLRMLLEQSPGFFD